MAYRLAGTAEAQIDALLLESARTWGLEAAGRYGQLILTAMEEIGNEPDRLGSVTVPRLPSIQAYPLRLVRHRAEPARRVGRPRHLIIYRLAPDAVVDILGLVHDRMVLSRAARRLLTSNDGS